MNQNNIDMYHDLIESIVAALEARDEYTAYHSRRVSDMCEQTCLLMNLSKQEANKIHMAVHVHDIGKIGIPDSVLTKPSSLDVEEWKLMKEHSRIGANILNKSSGLIEIADIVLHHHERWDGKGYPDKIKKTNIPFGSRMIAICDSIDAMMSKRSYRKIISSDECRNEIQINIGIMYDPNIAAFIIDHWEQIVTPIDFK